MAEFLGKYIETLAQDGRQLDVDHRHRLGNICLLTEVLTDDVAQNDTVLFAANLPWGLMPSFVISELAFTAFGSGVTFDLGIKDDSILGVTSKTDVFVSALSIAAAGTASALDNLAITDRGKMAWELAGLTEMPTSSDGWSLVGTFEGANPASGSIAIEQAFVKGG